MPPGVSNIVTCPSCGAENIEGADRCESCGMDIAGTDLPATASEAESEFNTPISSVRLSRPSVIAAAATVAEAVDAVARDIGGSVVVMDGARIAGIFTERDVLKKVAGRPAQLRRPVADLMTADPVVLREDDTMATALNKMGAGGFRHIPLTRDGELVGIVTARDVLQWLMTAYFDAPPP
jgi:CBS domain-containing protein